MNASHNHVCVVLWTKTHVGDGSLDVARPLVWNAASFMAFGVYSYMRFRHLLKAHLYDCGCGTL